MAQKVANITDAAVRIPFIGIKVGLDFLIGLIPFVGDVIMLAVATSIISMGKSMGVPKPLLMKMVRNSVLDFALGLIPFIGDIIDLFYKSNQSNVRIMERWWVENNKPHIDNYAKKQLEKWHQSLDEKVKPPSAVNSMGF